MRPFVRGKALGMMRRHCLAIGLLLTGLPAATAQSLPAGGDAPDLVTPPELRSGPAGRPPLAPDARGRVAKQRRTGRGPSADRPAVLPSAGEAASRSAAPAAPVGFGVHVQGGSSDPHFYSPTAAAADSQGAGSGVTAGIKFGF